MSGTHVKMGRHGLASVLIDHPSAPMAPTIPSIHHPPSHHPPSPMKGGLMEARHSSLKI